jgi:hypothetical protein
MNMENNNKKENQVNIELSEDMATGVYSNLAIITHSPSEVITDFVQLMPGMPKGKVRSRVIMTPQNAKKFMHALLDNIQKYEQSFGVIEEVEGGATPMNFGTPTTQA